MNKYKETKISSSKMGERNDCVVIALSITSGKSYEEIHEILKKYGRKDRRGTYFGTIRKAVLEVNPNAVFDQVTKPGGGKYTSRTIGKVLTEGNYIVFTRGHAAALVDGVIEDWSADRCKRINKIIKL